MPDSNTWLLIINPYAGKGKTNKDFEFIKTCLQNAQIKSEIIFTEQKNHAIQIASEGIEKGYKKIIAIGGDGTLNEVVNGLFLQKKVPTNEITLAVIPSGTGNDWLRTFQVPLNISESIDLIAKGTTVVQDAGKISYMENESIHHRFFINNSGVGFDSFVVEQTNKQKERNKSGKFAYLLNLFLCLLKYKKNSYKITIDDTILNGKFLSICAGIGKYNGGGMMPLPDSITDDGLFDMSVFTDIKMHEVILNLAKLYNGKIYSFHKIKKFQGRKITIQTESKCRAETDGEMLGHGPFSLEIIPRSIKIIAGR